MYDLVVNNGSIIDPQDGIYQANIGIDDGRITEISPSVLSGRKEIDALNHFVSPGFIDIHMHEDELQDNQINPQIANSSLLMGVTTSVGGNCGLGPADVNEYKEYIDNKGFPVNYLALLGHASLREEIGLSDRYSPATGSQIEKMIPLLHKGLADGAVGLSIGLEYTPGATIEELFTLSKTVAEYDDRMVAAHYRYDAERALEAVAELIIVARDTGVKMQISHLGSGTAFGKTEEALRMIESAYQAGVNLGVDVYPYDAFCSIIGSAVFDQGCLERWGVDYAALQVAEGKFLGENCTREIFDYKRKYEPDSMIVAFVMKEEEVKTAMQYHLAAIASDGRLINNQGHPRSAGTFPRVLGRYVRDKNCLDLETAIAKMTSLPASRLGLEKTKGRIKQGFDADITIFNYETVNDRATYKQPTTPPTGIEHVIVNGIEAVEKGRLTGYNPGKFISC